ncbi:MAG: CocE/NonD family hydrolase [Rhizobiaceae bacterium]
MKKIAFGFLVFAAAAGGAIFWLLNSGPELHPPSDISDLLASPDSPIVLTDVSDIEDEIIIERDLSVIVRDGTRLSANVFRPKGGQKYPVVMMITAYHKDEGPRQYPGFLRNHLTPDFDVGRFEISPWTPWEGPDPAYWVGQGYAVVMLDTRGYGRSEGVADVLSLRDRQDFHDAINWAGTQDWSNGRVGLTGVSYLAIAQWIAGSSAPEHLKAITPWEGQSDNFREVLFHGGIPETAFTKFWLTRVRSKANETSLPPAAVISFANARPMLMKWLQENMMPASGIALDEITVPALICASWSDHGMHTRGSFEGFKQISSKQKWIYNHGRSKWDVYYSADALKVQTAFFDRFLKGEDNGFEQRPAIRFEVRETIDKFTVREADDWPLSSTVYTPLYLDASRALLVNRKPEQQATLRYDAQQGEAVFRLTFDKATELVGNMKLKLWVEAEGASDMDLFVAVKNFNVEGEEVTFYGKAGYVKHPVALGWMRVSLREPDPDRSTKAQPVQAFERSLPLEAGEIVPVEIEILPSGTRFLPGETLALAVRGFDHVAHGSLAHDNTVNEGTHVIHSGGDYDSHLLVPVLPAE